MQPYENLEPSNSLLRTGVRLASVGNPTRDDFTPQVRRKGREVAAGMSFGRSTGQPSADCPCLTWTMLCDTID